MSTENHARHEHQDHSAHERHHPARVATPPGAHDGHEGHAGGDKHAGHSVEMFRNKFWISLALTVPTVVWGHMLARLTGYMPPMFPGSEWIPPVFGTAVFFYGGLVFIEGAVRELKERLPGMMT